MNSILEFVRQWLGGRIEWKIAIIGGYAIAVWALLLGNPLWAGLFGLATASLVRTIVEAAQGMRARRGTRIDDEDYHDGEGAGPHDFRDGA